MSANKGTGVPGRRMLDKVPRYTTVIGGDSQFSGVFTGTDNYVVHGQLEGECRLDNALVIMEQGRVRGTVRARVVVVAGEMEGDLQIAEKLELRATARVRGRIHSPVIAIANGAIHDGEIHMGDATRISEFQERRQAQGIG